MRRILGALKRADERFDLIADGDVIAVGLSGGKDSMALLNALTLYKRFSKKSYTLRGICVDLGFDGFRTDVVEEYCQSLSVPLDVVKTDIAEVVFDIRKEKNPCSLCAKMRKGALYGRAVERGVNKVAFAHHMDDALNTFFMSMMYEARLNTLQPVTFLSRTGVTLIRPLILAREYDIVNAVRRGGIPFFKNPCPADEHTVRQQTKDIVKYINGCHDGATENMMAAIQSADRYNLWSKYEVEK